MDAVLMWFTVGSGITKDHERIVLLVQTMLQGMRAGRRHCDCSPNAQDEMTAGNDVQGRIDIICNSEIGTLLTLSVFGCRETDCDVRKK